MGRRRRGERINGWLVLDKPEGMTSTHAVNQVRRFFNAQKAGHAGTLDPLASGILPIALGEATKLVNYVINAGKIYDFDVLWGEERDTDDSEGEITAKGTQPAPDTAGLNAVLPLFTGVIEQIPPQFSAIRINGERAYDRARRGEASELCPRTVRIDQFDVREDGTFTAPSGLSGHRLTLRCGRGVYVRSLARDLGRHFGCYGYVAALRRRQVGPFLEENAISLEKLQSFSHKEALETVVQPVECALADIPALKVTEAEAKRIRCGQTVFVPSSLEGEVYVTGQTGILAIAEVEKGRVNPVRVFNL